MQTIVFWLIRTFAVQVITTTQLAYLIDELFRVLRTHVAATVNKLDDAALDVIEKNIDKEYVARQLAAMLDGLLKK